jgi:hypothetical protein
VPLVVRLEGTNVELGKKIIRESGLNVIPADDLDDAAQKIVAAIKGREGSAARPMSILMSILIDKNTKVICQGFTGKTGTFHTEQAHRLRHQDGRRRHAGQGRQKWTRLHLACRCSTRSRSARRRPAPTPR